MKIATVRRFALSLPETTEAPHFHFTSFRVHGKIFATAPPDNASVNIFVAEQERDLALATESGFVEKLMWGGKAVGVRVLLTRARPKVVNALLLAAWLRKAPPMLVTRLPVGFDSNNTVAPASDSSPVLRAIIGTPQTL